MWQPENFLIKHSRERISGASYACAGETFWFAGECVCGEVIESRRIVTNPR